MEYVRDDESNLPDVRIKNYKKEKDFCFLLNLLVNQKFQRK